MMTKYKPYLIGALVGGVIGFLYWQQIGCANGTCLITGKPLNATAYFGLIGALSAGVFQKSPKKQD